MTTENENKLNDIKREKNSIERRIDDRIETKVRTAKKIS